MNRSNCFGERKPTPSRDARRLVSRRDALAAIAALAIAPAIGCSNRLGDRRLRLAIEAVPLTLDPRGPFNADTAHVQQLVFNTLVTKGPDFDLLPEIATSWDIAHDQTVHTFALRSDVHFHDGRVLSARDVAATFESLLHGSFGKSPNFHALDRVEAVDLHTVRFVSKAPNPGLLVDLVAVGLLPEGSTPNATPVGTGPFRIVTFDRDTPPRLDAFDGYFAGRPVADGIDVLVIPDATSRASALEVGEADLAINTALTPEAIERLGRPGASTRVVSSEGGAVQYVALNVDKSPLDDARVRRALALALDRRQIVDTLLGGRARLSSGPLPPGHWARAPIEPEPFDPEGARSLLREARGDQPVRLELLTSTSSADVALAAVFQQFWKAIGIETTITTAEPGGFFDRLTYGDFAAAIHKFTGGNQFTTIFKGAFHTRSIHTRGEPGGEINYSRLSDPTLDAAIERADLAVDRAERVRLYHEVQNRVVQAAPWIALWHPHNVAVLGRRVGPVSLNPGGDFYCVRSGPLA